MQRKGNGDLRRHALIRNSPNFIGVSDEALDLIYINAQNKFSIRLALI